ncbi:aspartate aminotransferase family protein [Novispirillum itersonii]|uniref:Acetylornithine aminotransferase n=1 Tax=Novispirillum itersonii TaxID=189 RepID=A0A7W9ZKQ5_NOVIT|nr:aspartate aminotransferase family protein [Novispirillum itersonii]MBB6212019.1 acetylornithine/N-succinyldiaminopimelate aminotransferase [Novispirillum itersonii]
MTIPAVMPTYARFDLAFERGEGAWMYTVDGRRFLDFGSGIAVNALGHAHPHLVKVLQDQAATLWHTSNMFHIPGQQKLAERLVANTFADTVFFCNSGAEALELSIKIARRYQQSQGNGRYRVITARNAFHGRTLATLAAAGQQKYLEGFGPVVEGFDHVAFGNLNEARAAVTPETAAVLVEPIQGEGGITPASADYLRGLRAMCDEYGLLLMFDEVQCGVGRTGKLFDHQWTGITPDVMAVAKGLGGGFPVGACLATEKAAACMGAGSHGSTFGGNPLAMAVANGVLDVVLAPGFLDQVNATAAVLWPKLEALVAKYPGVITEVRGRGLMIGLKCAVTNSDLVKALHAQGMVTVAGGDNVVRLLPPLTIGDAEIAAAIEKLDGACAALSAGGAA